jgi:hypothetical protein
MAFSASPEALVELNGILEVLVELKTAPVAHSSRADHTAYGGVQWSWQQQDLL